DKYSTFVPPERVAGASLQMEERIVGIGVQLELDDMGAKIQKVIPQSPAEEARLQRNDVIVAVSGRNLAGMTLDQTAELITGPVGSSVELAVQRGKSQAFTVSVPRRNVELHSVTDV